MSQCPVTCGRWRIHNYKQTSVRAYERTSVERVGIWRRHGLTKVKMRKTEQHRGIVEAEGGVECSLGSARWTRRAEASLRLQSAGRGERVLGRDEPVPGNATGGGHLFLKPIVHEMYRIVSYRIVSCVTLNVGRG